MTIPVYKIEVYDSSDTLTHTIEDEALSIMVKEVLTDNIGTFSFTLPTVKGLTNKYYFNDIAVHNKVKIWLGYNSVSGDPITVGRIYRITAPLNAQSGYLRHFSCYNQSEILQRRIKTRKVWEGIGASTIVTELANDLGLGTTEIETDTTAVTLTVDADTYFNVLKKVSDYWYDASTQIKKDFYVDINNNLVWKSRPIRTSGVETLTVGDNLLSYNVVRDITKVKNKIWVYGRDAPYDPNRAVVNYAGRTYPSDGDSWTYGTGWTATAGTLSSDTTNPKVGANDLRCASNDDYLCQYHRTFSQLSVEGKAGYSALQFWGRRSALLSSYHHVRLWCPDNSNYFEWEFADPGSNGVWAFRITRLGDNNTYDADTNPNGEWVAHGSPSWNDIEGIEFVVNSGVSFNWDIDGLCFSFGRWRATAEDATSQSNYGQRDYMVVDDTLYSDSDCQKRAETLLYQLKDPVIRLDISTPGNTNIKIGDRLTITIPAEGISAQSFDVISVTHRFSSEGFITNASLVSTENVREAPTTSLNEFLIQQFRKQSEIGKGVQLIATPK